MDFQMSPRTAEFYPKVEAFMQEHVLPNEGKIDHEVETLGEKFNESPTMNDIRKKAKAQGLWNLFLPDPKHGPGLSNFDYAPLCELMGRSFYGARAFNCMAPDTGNMEILAEFGSDEQKK
jgi:acyl-CoA dehydrogenase